MNYFKVCSVEGVDLDYVPRPDNERFQRTN